MPPKRNQENPKAKAGKKAQAAADKTFGLKNKNKSSKVQAYVKQVETQTSVSAQSKAKVDAERRAADKRAADLARLESLKLFQPVQTQKVPFGVDPKTVVCAFFKKGLCTKGNKCKFSHDLEVERKAQKKNLYTDERTVKENDTMDTWDEEKLRKVVMSKQGNPKTTTDIVCKYFIDAVENGKYGWFWQCPNGGNECKYKHSLPPGFKLKTKEEQRLERIAASNKVEITLEDFLEVERGKLSKELTPVTLESFTKWKQQREQKKAEEDQEAQKQQQKAGAKNMSGKQLLDSGKFVFEADDDNADDDDAWDLSALRRRVESDDEDNDGEENGEVNGEANGEASEASEANGEANGDAYEDGTPTAETSTSEVAQEA